jgi:hypothetical protein
LAVAAAASLFFASNVGPIPRETVDLVGATSHLLETTERAWLHPMLQAYVAAWSYPAGDTVAAAAAVGICSAGVAAVRSVGPAAEAAALQPLLWVHLDAGHLEDARRCADAGIAAAEKAGLSFVESRFALNRSRIALANGDLDQAWRDAERAVASAHRTGEPFVVVAATEHLAEIAERQGHRGRAAALLVSVLDAMEDVRSPEEIAEVRSRIARDARVSGEAASTQEGMSPETT